MRNCSQGWIKPIETRTTCPSRGCSYLGDQQLSCWLESKKFANDTEEADGSILKVGDGRSPVFLKITSTLDTFHRLGKDFSFKQWLNNFTKIGDSSGLIFLMTTIEMLSGPVAFLGSRLLINLLIISRAVVNTTEIVLSETEEVGKMDVQCFLMLSQRKRLRRRASRYLKRKIWPRGHL